MIYSGDITNYLFPSRHGVLSSNSICPEALQCIRSSDSAGRVMQAVHLRAAKVARPD
jgi:hypothetical protein